MTNCVVAISSSYVGDVLPSMALYLKPTLHVDVPLEMTYAEAFRGLPGFGRDVVASR